MPPYSPCGLAVDWVRSSHSGYWRFYPNAKDVVTGGFYYFLPKGTPHLNTPHYFGTADWTNDELVGDKPMGEIRGLARRYARGTLAAKIPPPRTVGTLAQISSDWTWPLPMIERESFGGVDSRCYASTRDPVFQAYCAQDSLCMALIYARLLQLVYGHEWATLDDFWQSQFGAGYTVTHFETAGAVPAMYFVLTPSFGVALISGTANFQQFALQGFTELRGPVDVGGFSSLRLWNNTANLALERFVDFGLAAESPVIIAGHSYGAAVATLMAARLRLPNRDRDICLKTFACPKPGDTRLREITDTIDTLNVVNDDDLITSFPPSHNDIERCYGYAAIVLFLFWTRWTNIRVVTRLDWVGNATIGQPATFDTAVLIPIFTNALLHNQINPIDGHLLSSYLRRLQRVCDRPDRPITQASWNIIFGVVPFNPKSIMFDVDGDLVRQSDKPMGVKFATVGIVNWFFVPNGVKLKCDGDLVGPGEAGPIALGGDGIMFGDLAEIALGGEGILGPELAGEGVRLGGAGVLIPGVERLGVKLGGAGTVETPLVPGSSCTSAGVISSFDTNNTFTIGSGVQQWFQFPVTNGVTYYCKVTVNTGSIGSALFYTGSDCTSKAERFSLFPFPTACNTYAVTATGHNAYILVTAGLFGSGNYTIRVGTGSCP